MAAIVRSSLTRKFGLISPRIFVSSSFHSSPVRAAVLVKMPSLSPTMTSGVIVNWNKKPGDTINPGDVLCEIQTDKAVMAFELEEEGTLAKIMGPDDGKECVVGVPIAVLAEPGEEWQTVASTFKHEEEAGVKDVAVTAQATESPDESKATGISHKQSKALGPATRMLLQRYGLTASQVPATGPKGLLLKGDVLSYVKKENLTPAPIGHVESQPTVAKATKTVQKKSKPSTPVSGEVLYQDINLSPAEVEVATRLLSSKVNIPHSYGSVDCNVDKIQKLCQQYQAEGIQVSTIDVAIKAISIALTLCPEISAIKTNGEVMLPSSVNISVASVSEEGIRISNITDAPSRGIEEISALNKSSPENVSTEGSFMVLNLGHSEVESCNAVISAPQCSALTIGSEHIALDDDANPSVSVKVTLSFDGEAIPVETASRFLKVLRGFMESPNNIVLGLDTVPDDLEVVTI